MGLIRILMRTPVANHEFGVTLIALALFLIVQSFQSASKDSVSFIKKPSSGICHDADSPYYFRIKNYTAYTSLKDYINSGGRTPKLKTVTSQKPSRDYQRTDFAHWIDEDQDCMNTRHEILALLSTVEVHLSEDGCRVVRGRWVDPYSGKVIFNA